MKIWSDSFTEGGLIAPRCAFAEIDPGSHIKLSTNRSPHVAWDEVPWPFPIDRRRVFRLEEREPRHVGPNDKFSYFINGTQFDHDVVNETAVTISDGGGQRTKPEA